MTAQNFQRVGLLGYVVRAHSLLEETLSTLCTSAASVSVLKSAALSTCAEVVGLAKGARGARCFCRAALPRPPGTPEATICSAAEWN
eukprot:6059519-Pyramimonas_sp.AAC.1